MYYSKKNMEPIQEEETSVWMCSQDKCACWMRENFAFEDVPVCRICKSDMVRSTKMLPNLYNNNHLFTASALLKAKEDKNKHLDLV